MKKVLLTAVVIFTVLELQAQFGIYVGGGYGCGPQEWLGTDYMADENMEMESPIFGSLGTALALTLGADYDLCDYGGVGVEVDYVSGIRQTIDLEDVRQTFFNSQFQSEERNTAIQVVPNAFIRVPFDDTWSGFGRIGPVLHLMGQNNWRGESTSGLGAGSTTYIWEEITKQRIALGARASVALNYKISDQFSLDLEAYTQNLSVKTKSSEVTLYTEDGDDILGDLNVYDKMVDYVDKLDQNSNNSFFNDDYDDNQAQEQLVQTHFLSRTGFRLGARFRF